MDITLDDLRPRESQPVSKQSADISYELNDVMKDLRGWYAI